MVVDKCKYKLPVRHHAALPLRSFSQPSAAIQQYFYGRDHCNRLPLIKNTIVFALKRINSVREFVYFYLVSSKDMHGFPDLLEYRWLMVPKGHFLAVKRKGLQR